MTTCVSCTCSSPSTLLAGVGIRDNPRLPAAAGVLLLLTVFLLVDVDMVFKPF